MIRPEANLAKIPSQSVICGLACPTIAKATGASTSFSTQVDLRKCVLVASSTLWMTWVIGWRQRPVHTIHCRSLHSRISRFLVTLIYAQNEFCAIFLIPTTHFRRILRDMFWFSIPKIQIAHAASDRATVNVLKSWRELFVHSAC